MPQNTPAALNLALLAVQELYLLDLSPFFSLPVLAARDLFVSVNVTCYLLQAHFFCSPEVKCSKKIPPAW